MSQAGLFIKIWESFKKKKQLHHLLKKNKEMKM